ncbi:MAG: ABC transporter permease [Eubacteriales bacterium]
MSKFVFRRLGLLIPIFLGISLVASLLFYIVPGDIVRVMLGQHVDPLTYANVRRALGLDISFWQNFLGFMHSIIRGDLGYSYIQQRPVTQIILEALPVTVKLTVVSLCITVIVGIPAGIIAAVRDRQFSGRLINFTAVAGISLPSFLLALFLQLIFGISLGWLPVSGPGRGLLSYILPGLAIGLPLAAFYAKVARASMQEVLTREYIVFALSRGLPFSRVIINHGLRNALVPVLTQMGMDFGMFMTGAVLTETIFNLPGMGRLVYSSINVRDFPVLRGILLLFALVVVLANLLVDLIYTKLDPRMAVAIVREETNVAGQTYFKDK